MGFAVYLDEGRIVPELSKIRTTFDKLRKQVVWKTSPKRSIFTGKFVFPHSPKSLIALLNHNFKPLHINFIYNKKLPHDVVGEDVLERINAYLDVRHRGITVEVGPIHLYNLMDPEEYDAVIGSFISMVGHELIHLEQLNRRLHKIGMPHNSEDPAAYFSNPMEIQSYAWQIVNDLQDLRLSKSQALSLIKNQKKLAETNTIFAVYVELFEPGGVVMKSVLKRIFQYVEEVYF
jgi:hypothetical protein